MRPSTFGTEEQEEEEEEEKVVGFTRFTEFPQFPFSDHRDIERRSVELQRTPSIPFLLSPTQQ